MPSTRSARPSSGAPPSSRRGSTDPDGPGSWEADYEVLAIDGDACVAHGRTRYLTDDRAAVDREFANVFVIRFDDDGRCREFTEWYMRTPARGHCPTSRRAARAARCTLALFDPRTHRAR